MSRAEMAARGWDCLDVLIVTGDAYVDHPSFGAAVVGRVLEAEGLRVGVVAQPDWRNPDALRTMGKPALFVGVTAGNLDSMLAHHNAARNRRREDDFSEGGRTGGRPDFACVVYAQLARQAFPGVPVVLGGIEASLRRIAHYDYWQDRVRPSILADSKADLLVYGMGEWPVIEVARRLAKGDPDLSGIPGTARLAGARETASLDLDGCVELPSWEAIRSDPDLLLPLTRAVEAEQNPDCGRRLVQHHGNRALVVEPPAHPLTQAGMDRIYDLPFTRMPHPSYRDVIPAYVMIRDSVTALRGCPGGCSFCGLGLHQGRRLAWRSRDSVLRELARVADTPGFRGTVTDVGGPTANLYGCRNDADPCRRCRKPSCLHPVICRHFVVEGGPWANLLRAASRVPGVRHVFVGSGVRMDVALRTPEALAQLVRHHVSGRLKVAPEHLDPDTLRRMRKPAREVFDRFRKEFKDHSRQAGKPQSLVPYFISSFPGCDDKAMATVQAFLQDEGIVLEQVQDFIPLPMTPGAAMYVTGRDYDTGEAIHVARGLVERRRQVKRLLDTRGPAPGRPVAWKRRRTP
jgi:uncharacterized radical SAM protein YgiQ